MTQGKFIGSLREISKKLPMKYSCLLEVCVKFPTNFQMYGWLILWEVPLTFHGGVCIYCLFGIPCKMSTNSLTIMWIRLLLGNMRTTNAWNLPVLGFGWSFWNICSRNPTTTAKYVGVWDVCHTQAKLVHLLGLQIWFLIVICFGTYRTHAWRQNVLSQYSWANALEPTWAWMQSVCFNMSLWCHQLRQAYLASSALGSGTWYCIVGWLAMASKLAHLKALSLAFLARFWDCSLDHCLSMNPMFPVCGGSSHNHPAGGSHMSKQTRHNPMMWSKEWLLDKDDTTSPKKRPAAKMKRNMDEEMNKKKLLDKDDTTSPKKRPATKMDTDMDEEMKKKKKTKVMRKPSGKMELDDEQNGVTRRLARADGLRDKDQMKWLDGPSLVLVCPKPECPPLAKHRKMATTIRPAHIQIERPQCPCFFEKTCKT